MSSPSLAAASRAVLDAAEAFRDWIGPISASDREIRCAQMLELVDRVDALRRLRSTDPLQEARDLVAEYMANGSTAAPKLLALLDRAISARGGGQ